MSDAIQRAESSQNQANSILKQVESGNSQPTSVIRTEADPILNISITNATFELGKHRICWRQNDYFLRCTQLLLAYERVASCTESHQPSATEEPIPISRRLWESLLDLLESDEEATWIDQLCLDQTDRLEKASAAASIDALYASANLFCCLGRHLAQLP